MRSLVALLIVAAAAAADNPPSDLNLALEGAGARKRAAIDTPQDVTFGRVFRVGRNEQRRDCVDVSGKLHGFDMGKKPLRVLLAFDDDVTTVGMGTVLVEPNGLFACRCMISSRSSKLRHGHSVRLKIMIVDGKKVGEPFSQYTGILAFP
jgi:hypothetical protein